MPFFVLQLTSFDEILWEKEGIIKTLEISNKSNFAMYKLTRLTFFINFKVFQVSALEVF